MSDDDRDVSNGHGNGHGDGRGVDGARRARAAMTVGELRVALGREHSDKAALVEFTRGRGMQPRRRPPARRPRRGRRATSAAAAYPASTPRRRRALGDARRRWGPARGREEGGVGPMRLHRRLSIIACRRRGPSGVPVEAGPGLGPGRCRRGARRGRGVAGARPWLARSAGGGRARRTTRLAQARLASAVVYVSTDARAGAWTARGGRARFDEPLTDRTTR